MFNDLEKLFIYLCLHSDGFLAHQACARDLGTTTTTVATHLTLLEQAGLIYRLPPSGLLGKKVLKGVTQRDVDFAITRLKGTDTTLLKIPAYILCFLLGQSERFLWT